MTKLSYAAAAAAVGVAAGASLAQQSLFGVGGFSAFGTQSLYRIDTTTGAATLIGDTGLTQIADIAWDQSRQTLFAQTVFAELYILNPVSGSATLVGTRSAIAPEGALAVGPTGGLWAAEGDTLTRLNRDTGFFETIGLIGLIGEDASGLAFTGTGDLFGYAKRGPATDAIVRINTLTGQATLFREIDLGTTGPVGGLAFLSGQGSLWISSGDRLFSLSESGTLTTVGEHGVPGMSGIAFIPAPGTVAFGVMGLALAARRRRNKYFPGA